MFIMAEPSSSNYIDFETLLEWSSNVVVIDLPYSFESKDMSTYYNVLSATAPIWVDHPNFFSVGQSIPSTIFYSRVVGNQQFGGSLSLDARSITNVVVGGVAIGVTAVHRGNIHFMGYINR